MENRIEDDLRGTLDKRFFKFESSFDNKSNEITKDETPMTRFLYDEIEFTRRTLNRVRLDLDSIAIDNNETPEHWLKDWETGPKDAVAFVNGLIRRYRILESTLDVANGFTFRVDLSGVDRRPGAFLAALKQRTAREINHPLENLQLRANWIEDHKSEQQQQQQQWKVSVILEGLLISGALIKDGKLIDVDANDAPITAAPICQIAYLPERYSIDKDNERRISRSHYDGECDEIRDWLDVLVYSNSKRNAFVCSLPNGCPRENRNAWSKRSVTIYLRSL